MLQSDYVLYQTKRMPSKNTARQIHLTRPKAAPGSPIERKTMAMLTVDAIREKILAGEYREGEPLRQDAVAAELGVSRIPVREALRQLETEGLVTFHAHSGAAVSMLSLGEIKELFELRALIEADLLRKAIPVMQDKDLERAEEILEQYEVALADGDVAAWGVLNWQYHSALYAPADQHLTTGIVQSLHNQSDRYLRMQLALTRGETRAKEEHRAIFNAVREGEVLQSTSFLTAHILGAGRSLLDFLRERRERFASEDVCTLALKG